MAQQNNDNKNGNYRSDNDNHKQLLISITVVDTRRLSDPHANSTRAKRMPCDRVKRTGWDETPKTDRRLEELSGFQTETPVNKVRRRYKIQERPATKNDGVIM